MENLLLTQKSKSTKTEKELVKGVFTPLDAQYIMDHLISEKISFHKLQNLSHQERFGKENHESIDRIVALKKTKKEIQKIIIHAIEMGKNLKIEANINVELV